MPNVIDKFDGEYFFLSNFYPCDVNYDGMKFRNAEAAFQSAKTVFSIEKSTFTVLDASSAKKLGRQVLLRKDWEQMKDKVMYDVCYAKFSQNPELLQKLLNTSDSILIEGNTWGDRIWGIYKGEGENRLGKILMQIRDELRKEYNNEN